MSENISLPLLDRIQIASPCSARWEDMQGNDVTRFCGQCNLHVHNISAMTAPEAESFLRQTIPSGRVCARFYRRPDGTILTQDCPVGFALMRKRVASGLAKCAAALILMFTGGVVLSSQQRAGERLRQLEPFKSVCAWLNPIALPVPPTSAAIQGDICVMAPTSPSAIAQPLANTPPPQTGEASAEGNLR